MKTKNFFILGVILLMVSNVSAQTLKTEKFQKFFPSDKSETTSYFYDSISKKKVLEVSNTGDSILNFKIFRYKDDKPIISFMSLIKDKKKPEKYKVLGCPFERKDFKNIINEIYKNI